MTKLLLVLFLQISQERPVIQRELCIVRQPQCVRACVSKYVLQKSIGTCVCVCVGVRACLQMQTHIQVQTSILLQEYLEVGNGSSCKWVQKFDFFFVPFAARSAAGFQFPDAGTCNSRNLWPNNAHGTESDSGNSRWSGSTLGFKDSKKNLVSNLYLQPIIQQVLSPHSLKKFRKK